jgi:hypothetical protein
MSFNKGLPLALVAAAFVIACSDASSPTDALSVPTSALAKKGGSGGGGGGNGGSVGTELVITTPPTVNVTGTWVTVNDGQDVVSSAAYTISQTAEGIVTGSGIFQSSDGTRGTERLVGTVNGDTLTLYIGIIPCSCTPAPLYRGIVSSDGEQAEGSYFTRGTPVTLNKQ